MPLEPGASLPATALGVPRVPMDRGFAGSFLGCGRFLGANWNFLCSSGASLLSQGCHNKRPHTGWVLTTGVYSLTVLEAGSPIPRYGQGGSLLQAPRGLVCLPLSWMLEAATILGDIWLVAASLPLFPRPRVSLPIKRTLVIGLGPVHPSTLISTPNYPQRPYFQIRLHSEVLGLEEHHATYCKYFHYYQSSDFKKHNCYNFSSVSILYLSIVPRESKQSIKQQT